MTEGRLISLVSEDLLQDYVDGRLEPELEERVERLVFGDPELRARTLDYYALNHQLRKQRARYQPTKMPDEMSKLAAQLEGELDREKPASRTHFPINRNRLAKVAAVCVMVVGAASGGSYYWSNLQNSGVNLAQLMTLPSKDGGQTDGKATTVSVQGGTLDGEETTATTPELSPSFNEFGFELIETRILKGAGDGAVQLVYEAGSGERVMLYYSDDQNEQKTQVSVRQEGPLSMLFWQADGRAFTMLGELDQATLIELGQQVSEGLAVNGATKGDARHMQEPGSSVTHGGNGEKPVPAKQEIEEGDGSGSI